MCDPYKRAPIVYYWSVADYPTRTGTLRLYSHMMLCGMQCRFLGGMPNIHTEFFAMAGVNDQIKRSILISVIKAHYIIFKMKAPMV